MIKLFLPYVNDAARENVQRVLSGTQLAEGPEVKAFEEEFAKQFGFEPWQIVSVNSGTSALELAYDICGIGKPGEYQEVITPVLTCTATNVPLVRRNVGIVFADVNGKTSLNIDPYDVKRKISRHTKAIVYVHFGGSSEGLESIQQIAGENAIDLICDGAQVLGESISSTARFTAISLQAIKSLTSGDGGFLICRERTDAILARQLRWFGYDREAKKLNPTCDLMIAGYKYHMNDISAAIGRGNLQDWQIIQQHREILNEVYERTMIKKGGKGFVKGIWNPMVLGIEFQPMYEELLAAGFEIGQQHYRNDDYSVFCYAYSDCPNMNELGNKYFMLPCHMGVSYQNAEDIANIIWK